MIDRGERLARRYRIQALVYTGVEVELEMVEHNTALGWVKDESDKEYHRREYATCQGKLKHINESLDVVKEQYSGNRTAS